MSQYPNDPAGTPVPPAQPPRKWPTVVGTISAILGGLGVVCTPVNVGMQYVNPAQHQLLGTLPPWFQQYTLAGAAIGFVFAALLLAAGLLVLKRRQLGRTLHLVYCAIGLISAVVNVLVMLTAFAAPGIDPNMKVGLAIGLGCGLPLGLAYMIFLLVWFLRRSIAEEVRQWPA